MTVRDNVLFELGIFMGILGRKRVYVVAPSDAKNFRIPTDLLGLTLATYRQRSDGNLKAALNPACISILEGAAKVDDPEPNCAYTHTEKTSNVIYLGHDRFSVIFHPPMRASPTLQFIGGDGKSLTPELIENWTRYGFTVKFANSIGDSTLKFVANARPNPV